MMPEWTVVEILNLSEGREIDVYLASYDSLEMAEAEAEKLRLMGKTIEVNRINLSPVRKSVDYQGPGRYGQITYRCNVCRKELRREDATFVELPSKFEVMCGDCRVKPNEK